MHFFVTEVVNIPPSPPLAAVTTFSQAFRFMELPPELRVQVYEELVVVGKIFYTPDEYEMEESCIYEDVELYSAPMLSILRVSKAICGEASHVYLSQNTFVLPPRWPVLLPLWRGSTTNRYLFSRTANLSIRRIAVMLNPRGYSYPLTMCWSDWDNVMLPSFDGLTQKERTEMAHDFAEEQLSDDRNLIAARITWFQDLHTIDIDFANAYCPVGCCRILWLDWDRVLEFTKNVRLYGLSSMAEADLVKQDVKDSTNLTEEEIHQRVKFENGRTQ